MDDDLRVRLAQGLADFVRIANIGDMRAVIARNDGIQIRIGVRRQRVASYFRTQARKPQMQPRAFEARVPREKNAALPPKLPLKLSNVYPAFLSQ
jgi:hypothetical protein